jgi:hypothetical protein
MAACVGSKGAEEDRDTKDTPLFNIDRCREPSERSRRSGFNSCVAQQVEREFCLTMRSHEQKSADFSVFVPDNRVVREVLLIRSNFPVDTSRTGEKNAPISADR